MVRTDDPVPTTTAFPAYLHDGFQREQRRHARAMDEISKLDVRIDDGSIAGLEFLFEDYEPRCYLFPVFELGRRLFLSSVLAVFYPGSMQQVVVGLLGAMFSYVVYSYHQGYIEDDDDVVAIVAQGQLVLIYFAALAVYTSDVSDTKRAVFGGLGFGVVLVVIFLSSFVVAVYAILLDVFGDARLRHTYHTVSTQVLCHSKKVFTVARTSSGRVITVARTASGRVLTLAKTSSFRKSLSSRSLSSTFKGIRINPIDEEKVEEADRPSDDDGSPVFVEARNVRPTLSSSRHVAPIVELELVTQ